MTPNLAYFEGPRLTQKVGSTFAHMHMTHMRTRMHKLEHKRVAAQSTRDCQGISIHAQQMPHSP